MRTEVPRTSEGGWQWDYTGPIPDDEFGYSLNGHKYLPALYHQYQASGDSTYLLKLAEILNDWISAHPLPSMADSVYLVYDPAIALDYRDLGEVEWRTLEMGHRLGTSWPQIYFGLVNASSFGRDLRIRMLANLARQADFLKTYHKRGHNWTTMEMNGLALVGLAFPEFKRSQTWADYALQTMQQEINQQVYPDGAQVELAAKTQWVALNRFESIADNFAKAGQEIDTAYRSRITEMYNYMAYSMRPDGYQPLNSDADRESLVDHILQAANTYDRPDWTWIATNGKEGTLPSLGPSVIFPWAGVALFRSGWSTIDQWIFFDCGAYGTGHQHRDKLHLSLAAYGHDLLVDGGRFTHENYFSFDPTEWRGYFRSSHSHNVMLVNGKGQNAYHTRAATPLKKGIDYLVTDSYSVMRGSFEEGYEGVEFEVKHQRSVFHVLDQFVVVIDEVSSDEPCSLDFLWHFNPKATLHEHEIGLVADVEKVKLQLLCSQPHQFHLEQISGQTEPTIQGWYSSTYGEKEVNSTAVYSRKMDHQARQAWLLFPSLASTNLASWTVRFTSTHCIVHLEGESSHQWVLPLYEEDLASGVIN